MRRVVGRWLDALLGERCVCGQRVFPRDEAAHVWLEHAEPVDCGRPHPGPCSWVGPVCIQPESRHR